MSDVVLPPRIVHLEGGLRAVDDRSGTTFVQTDGHRRFFKFQSPDYPQLYTVLRSLGLHVIGADFLTRRASIIAPDWWVAAPTGGFRLETERRAWCELRHQAVEDRRPDIVDMSRRFTALVELLAIRILQMSDAYNGAFRSELAANPNEPGHMFDNTFVPYLEASIHAFLGDAANLRDLLAEFVWTFVLGQRGGVTSFKTFRSRGTLFEHPIAQEMIEDGKTGWIERLTRLRNGVFHVAPIGANHILPSCYERKLSVAGGGEIRCMSYGLLQRSPELQERIQSAIAARDEAGVKREMKEFKRELEKSEDALLYAWDTVARLCSLAERSRLASGLKGKMLQLTDEDIVRIKSVP